MIFVCLLSGINFVDMFNTLPQITNKKKGHDNVWDIVVHEDDGVLITCFVTKEIQKKMHTTITSK